MKLSIKKYIPQDFKFLIPIVIIFSSLRIFGYVTSFLFYIPYLIKNSHKVFLGFKNSSLIGKQILLFFSFIVFEIIFGTYFIKDLRIIIYWIPLFLVTLASYYKNIYDINKIPYFKNNYLKIIYKSCVIYFLFYFTMNIFAYIKYGQFYRVQDYLWIGSSGAFTVCSIFFYSISNLWEKVNFKISSSYTLAFLFIIFLVLLNESRLGTIYISLFLVYLLIKNFQLKNFFNIFLITSIVMASYSISSILIKQFHLKFSNNFGYTLSKIDRNLLTDTTSIFIAPDGREATLKKGLKKFSEYPTLNKIIGTGWYSSRITLNQEKEDIKPSDYRNKKITWPPAILAYLLDTGLIGIFISIYLFCINSILILKSKEDFINKIFIFSLLGITILNVFIGYPLVNIAYILFILPNGIIQVKNI